LVLTKSTRLSKEKSRTKNLTRVIAGVSLGAFLLLACNYGLILATSNLTQQLDTDSSTGELVSSKTGDVPFPGRWGGIYSCTPD
jgi:hypothetical protein